MTYRNGDRFQFNDVRMKVGNQVLRAYLLRPLLELGRVERVSASLRGPKNEFKDFAKFVVLSAIHDGENIEFLTETGVYENIRIVAIRGTDAEKLSPERIMSMFMSALDEPDVHKSKIVLSYDADLRV